MAMAPLPLLPLLLLPPLAARAERLPDATWSAALQQSEVDPQEPVGETMSRAYGANWARDGALADARRCFQWSVGQSPLADPHMEGSSDDDVGRWGCVSALLRDATKGLLGETHSWKNYTASSILEQKATKTAAGGDQWHKDFEVLKWSPAICQAVWLKDKSMKCSVKVYASQEFAKLRLREAQPNGRGLEDLSGVLRQSIDSGPVVPFNPGAGKSGSTFSRTWDDQFKIKLGLKYSMKMNEPRNMMELLKGRKGQKNVSYTLYGHFAAHPDSLLNRIYGVVSFKFGKVKSFAAIMMDATYNEATHAREDSNVVFQTYDLKGKSRSQVKKNGAGAHTLINGDFLEREANTVQMTTAQCKTLRRTVRHDADFLDYHSLIDYSLYMGLAAGKNGQPPKCRFPSFGDPFCVEGPSNKTYTFAIIDYLNNKNWYKASESAIRWFKFAYYGVRFRDYVDRICPDGSES